MNQNVPRCYSALRVFAVLCVSFALAGCSTIRLLQIYLHPLTVTSPAPPVPHASGAFHSGSASIDFTPPPGIPTGGDGPAATVARGYLSRLHARAFYFEDAAGKAFALVSCDQFAVPEGLRDAVAAKLAMEHNDVPLSRATIIVAATHSHQGPGNYMTARTHNEFASSRPGFFPPLFEFERDAVTQAIVAAHKDSLIPGDTVIRIRRGRFELLKNREPRSFLMNPRAEELMLDLGVTIGPKECTPDPNEARTPELNDGWDLTGCPRLRAVDRTLTAIDVSRAGVLHSRLLFLAVHPTVLPAETPFFGSDFVGYAVDRQEHDLQRRDRTATVAFFNGAEGDVVARRFSRDYRDVRVTGDALYEAAAKSSVERTFSCRDGECGIVVQDSDQPAANGRCESCGASGIDRCESAQLAHEPAYGAPALGGAEDDHTTLYELGWRGGTRSDVAENGQGSKQLALDPKVVRIGISPTRILAPPISFPERLPMTFAQIGALRLAAFPTEITTAKGLEIREALGCDLKHLESCHDELVLIGLANEYVGYTDTSAEYARQDYMGGSTIWGPDQGDYLQCRMKEVSKQQGETKRTQWSRTYYPGPRTEKPFGAPLVGERRTSVDDGLETILTDGNRVPVRNLPWFSWTEQRPASGDWPNDVKAMVRKVVIEEFRNGAWVSRTDAEGRETNDQAGFRVLVILRGSSGISPAKGNELQEFAAIWLDPLSQFSPPATLSPLPKESLGGIYRFHVTANEKPSAEFASCEFHLPLKYPSNEIADCSSSVR